MNSYLIEPSPHIKSSASTQKIMLHVIIALLPAVAAGTVIFGIKALLLVVLCATFCVIAEFIFNVITKKEQTISDLSAVVTGVILGLNLPVTLPVYMVAIGSFVAIVVVKQFFGGIGQNFANPAITARIVLMVSFASRMTNWVAPFWYKEGADAVASATPLVADPNTYSYMDLFLGLRSGCLGETCVLALLVGGLYLICLKIINPVTPVVYIGTVALLSFIVGNDVLVSVMSGGLMLGAFFMATDYATTPITTKGKLIFAIGCGVITFIIRQYSTYPEGVSFAILIMNILTPQIDKITMNRPFGVKKEGGKK